MRVLHHRRDLRRAGRRRQTSRHLDQRSRVASSPELRGSLQAVRDPSPARARPLSSRGTLLTSAVSTDRMTKERIVAPTCALHAQHDLSRLLTPLLAPSSAGPKAGTRVVFVATSQSNVLLRHG